MTDEQRCPVCGATKQEHAELQKIANDLRATVELPPLDPPDIETGFQKR